ncbi:hypothetical protein BDR22DRAFT_889612 [Usnea florida]
MASRPRRIGAAEWDSHKDTILNLRQSRVSIKGENGIVARMEKRWGFTASPAQYELQLSKWGARKNINADGWRRTLQMVDQHNEDGLQCAVYRNGELLSPLILRKKRNQHCKGQEYARLRRTRVSTVVLPECIEIKNSESQPRVAGALDVDGDEDRDEDGDENVMSSGPYNLVVTTSETTPAFAESHVGTIGGFGMGEQYIGTQMPVVDPFFEQPNETTGAMSAQASEIQEVGPSIINSISELVPDTPHLTMNHVPMDYDWTSDTVSLIGNTEIRETSLIGPHTPLNTVSDQDLMTWWHPNIQSPSFYENLETRGYQSPGLSTQQAVIHRQSKSPASRDVGEPGGSNARQLVSDTRPLRLHGSSSNSDDALLVVEDIGLRLSSLLISDDVSSNFLLRSRTAARHQNFGPSIYGSLVLCVENNFAGLDDVPIGSVVKFMEQGPQMRSQLANYLRALPKNISETVAKNLIRAAIEKCDAPMVTELLETRLVAPDDIVCTFEGSQYTAMARSAMLNSIDVTKALLIAGADIDKGYETELGLREGALYLAIRRWERDLPVDMHLVNMLLDHGAEVVLLHAVIAVEQQEQDLIQAIMSKISLYDHPCVFDLEGKGYHHILEDAVRLLDGELATTIIVQVVQACYQTICSKCSEAYSGSLMWSIVLAATRGHSRLVAFLVDYVADKAPALAGAVRSGKRDIIELLLEKGANPDPPGCIIDRDDDFFTTPFAEALRAKDDELIRYFHGLGATTSISEEGRFEAAIYAASEAGKLGYVNELLQMAPGMEGKFLNSALCISIRNSYEEVALTLLKAGADVNPQEPRGFENLGPALIEALHQKNKTLVLAIMECDVDVEQRRAKKFPLQAAAEWGDVSIIKNLLSMGANTNAGPNYIGMGETAVTVAVRAKNRPLVEFLVENGARLDVPCFSETETPLVAATSNKDLDMMQYLLDCGADPSCSYAISEAVKQGGEVLVAVLDAVRIKFPRSQKGLGAKALRSAIEEDNVELVDRLLEAKFDVNAIVPNDQYGSISALGMAIKKTSRSDLDTIKKLILAGGDPNSLVWEGYNHGDAVWPRRTAMLQAILTKSKPLVELLIDEGADFQRGPRLGLKRTPLQQACEVGAMEIVDLFLEKGVDVNEAPAVRGGATSLQLCAIKGFCGIAEKLLNLGADVHAAPSEVNGRTALDGAAENGRLDMIMLLWNATADKRFSSEQCSHAIKLAEENGHFACCDLIRQLDITSRDFLGQGRLSN